MNRKYLWLALCLFGFVLVSFAGVLHLRLLEFIQSGVMLGDSGDGLFNLWVLEKHHQKLLAMEFGSPLSGNIFWPHGARSLFWSDNSLVYVPLYTLLRSICANLVTAFTALTYIVCLMGFAANFFFFHCIYQLVAERVPKLPTSSSLFVPLFAYCSHFSETKIRYFMHWQNLSYFWLLIILASCLSLSHRSIKPNQQRSHFCLIAISQTALFFSTPYFAVLGCLLILAWVLPYLRFRAKDTILLAVKCLPALIPCLGLSLMMVVLYSQNERQTFAYSYIHSLGIRWWHHFVPRGGLAYDFLHLGPWKLADINHESAAYLGIGLILSLLVICGTALKNVLKSKGNVRIAAKRLGLAVLIGIALRLMIEFDRDIGAIMVVTSAMAVLIRLLLSAQKPDPSGLKAPVLSLLASFLIANTLAMGPLKSFASNSVNPSFWWIFKTLLPPVENMRAIGRMAGLGQSVLCGLVLIFFLSRIAKSKVKARRIWHAVALLLCIAQFLDPIGSKAFFFRPEQSLLYPSLQASKFLDRLDGPGIAFPTTPYHENTWSMLYFARFHHLDLLNGYSAHSSPNWDQMMNLASKGTEPNSAQIDYAKEVGAKWAFFSKVRIAATQLHSLKALGHEILYEDEQIVIISVDRKGVARS